MINWELFGGQLSAVMRATDTEGKDLAEATGLDASTISRAKRGKAISAEGLLILSAWLKTDPRGYLITGHDAEAG